MPAPPLPPPVTVSTYPMTFTGTAQEYFRIWIVNLALSVVTLGLYIPWARIRTRQYFYGHTWLDGHNFEYTANPWALLRGYLIVAAFTLAYSLSINFPYQGSEWVALAVVALFVLFYPWLVRQSMRFLARSTVHRGLSFRFTETLGGAYLSYGLANILAGLSIGFAYPWAWFMQRRYQVEGLNYGSAKGHFRGDVGSFYVIALTTAALALGGSLIFGLLAVVAFGIWGPEQSMSPQAAGFFVVVVVAYLAVLLLYGLVGQYLRAAIMRYVLNNVELGGVVRLSAQFNPWMMAWITISNFFVQVVTLGLMSPWAAVRRTRYLIQNIQVRAIASLDDFSAAQADNAGALGEAATELFDINLGF